MVECYLQYIGCPRYGTLVPYHFSYLYENLILAYNRQVNIDEVTYQRLKVTSFLVRNLPIIDCNALQQIA